MSKRYTHWSARELKDLAAGVQKYGFCDPQKLSSLIKTKSASSVRSYIRYRINELRSVQNKLEKDTTPQNSWVVRAAEDLENWSTIRKWAKIADNQRPSFAAKKDYSRIVIKNLCQKFYDEAEEVNNPEVMDVKAIYKYMLQCVSGETPSQLPIKESTYILVLLRSMTDLIRKNNFQEESEFINNFKKRLEFVPVKVKEESKKFDNYKPGTVPIPIDLYENLRCHRQVVNSFNPFAVPMWLLSKEQDFFTHVFQNSDSVDLASSANKNNLSSVSGNLNSSSNSNDSFTSVEIVSPATSGRKEK